MRWLCYRDQKRSRTSVEHLRLPWCMLGTFLQRWAASAESLSCTFLHSGRLADAFIQSDTQRFHTHVHSLTAESTALVGSGQGEAPCSGTPRPKEEPEIELATFGSQALPAFPSWAKPSCMCNHKHRWIMDEPHFNNQTPISGYRRQSLNLEIDRLWGGNVFLWGCSVCGAVKTQTNRSNNKHTRERFACACWESWQQHQHDDYHLKVDIIAECAQPFSSSWFLVCLGFVWPVKHRHR